VAPPPGLVRAIGRWDFTAAIINGVIGSGIFSLPSVLAGLTGAWSPITFVLAGLGMLTMLLCMAEVASRFTEAGGPYLYVRESFGPVLGFQAGWLTIWIRILSLAANLNVFVEYLAEVVTSPVHSQIMRLKHYDFLRARDKSAAHLEVFRDVVLPDFPSIRETINSGERTISEFLKLLDQAQQFRGWLQAANPDRELLASYLRAATQSTWADNLPTKGARFAIITGMGMAVDTLLPTGLGTAAGVGLGAADALLLDKFIKGWRPNHFIEGPYKSFVKAEAA
jgi:amino acid transporter